ncbi:formate dehydrogenase subunit gamma [Microbaculum marinisediminis]|uniref:Formate dehydrogenase subunit gamma n=1 Tax=Microbaculum marinisediminis TaxID=2931392 RepID=A0AAW5QUC4_9HYPH|nr:formate dehydrogenase subunit gamma [Microbaculum sp. A6E488]MCT8971094.1 formate dehydrogenase subunit gamma [Microbaculum sp. A6E488]
MRLLKTVSRRLCRVGLAVAMTLVLAAPLSVAVDGTAFAQESPQQLRENPTGGQVPGNTLGGTSDTEFWRAIRGGAQGTVSIPDKNAGTLVQSEGETWRALRNGPLSTWGAWGLLGMIVLLALFFLIRGRIRIEHGWAGRTIVRFGEFERMGHWLLAVSFIILGLTGLNVLYGRYVLLPVIGPEAFGALTHWGKLAHNYVAFAFMLGLAYIFVMWVANNIPNRYDVIWLLKGGGLFSKHSHPPAKKFNAGQKILFWLVILGGVSISLSGIALMFPFQTSLFAKTFAFLNVFGAGLPTDLTALQEMQLAQLWHAIMALVLIIAILGHIYIGTIGMEGAFDAMGSGDVDLNWAKEHHSIWVEELEAAERSRTGGAAAEPAE